MTDELESSPATQQEIDVTWLNGKINVFAKRISPDIMEDPDYVTRRDEKRHSKILVTKDKKSFAVLSPSGVPMPGSAAALQRLAAELVNELEAERGPTLEAIMEAKRSTESYGI
jgi:hypothetical protein